MALLGGALERRRDLLRVVVFEDMLFQVEGVAVFGDVRRLFFLVSGGHGVSFPTLNEPGRARFRMAGATASRRWR
jgi:hypothetical protein